MQNTLNFPEDKVFDRMTSNTLPQDLTNIHLHQSRKMTGLNDYSVPVNTICIAKVVRNAFLGK